MCWPGALRVKTELTQGRTNLEDGRRRLLGVGVSLSFAKGKAWVSILTRARWYGWTLQLGACINSSILKVDCME